MEFGRYRDPDDFKVRHPLLLLLLLLPLSDLRHFRDCRFDVDV